MRYIKPVFYNEFNCTADKCPDTCCAGWQIMIDEDSLEYYGEVKGEFGRRLRDSIDWQEGSFYQKDRRCAFLNSENLCDLYTALGPDALCDTCRKYPRHVEEYEEVREWSLSLSCPVAARIILSQQGFWDFVVEEDDEPDELADEFEDFDLLLFSQLEDARVEIFRWLKDSFAGEDTPGQPLDQIMEKALKLAGDMQTTLDEGEFFQLEDWLETEGFNSEISGNELEEKLHKKEKLYEKKIFLYETIYDLERLRREWSDVLEEMYQNLYAGGMLQYFAKTRTFEKYLQEDPNRQKQWENIGLQLFVFFVYTYFCGAVYDDWIYTKMALAVHSVEFIRELFVSRWIQGGKLDMDDYVELSYRYAREIEHSDLNLNQLEDVFAENFEENFG